MTEQPIPGQNPEGLQSLPAGGPILPRNSMIRSVFAGPNGLRAGWRFLLYLAMVAAILFVILPAMRLLEPQVGKLWEMMAVEAVLFAAA